MVKTRSSSPYLQPTPFQTFLRSTCSVVVETLTLGYAMYSPRNFTQDSTKVKVIKSCLPSTSSTTRPPPSWLRVSGRSYCPSFQEDIKEWRTPASEMDTNFQSVLVLWLLVPPKKKNDFLGKTSSTTHFLLACSFTRHRFYASCWVNRNISPMDLGEVSNSPCLADSKIIPTKWRFVRMLHKPPVNSQLLLVRLICATHQPNSPGI